MDSPKRPITSKPAMARREGRETTRFISASKIAVAPTTLTLPPPPMAVLLPAACTLGTTLVPIAMVLSRYIFIFTCSHLFKLVLANFFAAWLQNDIPSHEVCLYFFYLFTSPQTRLANFFAAWLPVMSSLMVLPTV